MQPTLTTPRLALRPARHAHLEALWTLWTDPLVRRYLWDDRVVTRAEVGELLDDCLALAERGLGLWIVTPRAEARDADAEERLHGTTAHGEAHLIGCAGLFPVTTTAEYEPRLAGLVEPNVALAPSAWRQGYAEEALGALVAHATGTLGLTRLAAACDVPNEASDRMLRRAGFVPLSEVRGAVHVLRTFVREGTPAAPDDRRP